MDIYRIYLTEQPGMTLSISADHFEVKGDISYFFGESHLGKTRPILLIVKDWAYIECVKDEDDDDDSSDESPIPDDVYDQLER